MAKRQQWSKQTAPPPIAGERVPLGLRVTKETKAKLDQAAQSSGRSQSQEAEFRLEQTFRSENAVFDALDLAYGCHWTGLLMTLARVGVRTGTRACSLSQHVYESSEEWMSDPYAYDQVIRAINCVLEAIRPPGTTATPPDTLGLPPTSYMNLGAAFAQTELAAVVKPNEVQAQDSVTQAIRKRLADLIPRIRIAAD